MLLCFCVIQTALGEITDITDAAQLATVIHGIDDNFNITEEMAALFSMKGVKKGFEVNFTSFHPEVEQCVWCCDR
jgi:hypothetical protein